jgi:adenylate cyclase
MSTLVQQASNYQKKITPLLAVAVAGGLITLPLAVWLDLRGLSERMLRMQANEIGSIIDVMRDFYATDVVARVQRAGTTVTVTHAYKTIPGGIPIPATLSLELGKLISERNGSAKYRFVSDFPFKGRVAHPLDGFEQDAIRALRHDPEASVIDSEGSIFDRQVRVATPVRMGPVCVACHNTHPDSPKTDWKVGDVRGIQEVIVRQPLAVNIFAFKYLLSYFVLAAASGFTLIILQRRQADLINAINSELSLTNRFLASLSAKLSKYLPAQIHKSIFEGRKDAQVATERKKLTVFFSDIKDFTATTERLQPEELTALLNEYLTEMAIIAHRHGGTVDKFIGDAILVFFGDPETKGAEGDACACLAMAIEMQTRLERLNQEWVRRGIQRPFRARMGINTGYCNVGNFGSEDRLDYTIIGAEANLAARLQSSAEPGQIVLSFETYALVRDQIQARALNPIRMKGVSREITPYVVEGWTADLAGKSMVVKDRGPGLDLFLEIDAADDVAVERAKQRLIEALAALDSKRGQAAA